jgi:ABC-type bacteriocin/lantibiotic exporter with double-glycine peptidase domain
MTNCKLAALLIFVGSACSAFAQTSVWLDVPFVKQPAEGCGAASIAMVMQYWEQHQNVGAQSLFGSGKSGDRKQSDVNHIQRELYSKPAHGIYASDLQHYLESQGFATYVVHGDEALLAKHITRGRPLIVALKPTSAQALHYVVVAGVDPGENVVLVNDPAQRKLLKVDLVAFEKEWQATGNWTLLAVPRSSQP